jgi:hypothetical protein
MNRFLGRHDPRLHSGAGEEARILEISASCTPLTQSHQRQTRGLVGMVRAVGRHGPVAFWNGKELMKTRNFSRHKFSADSKAFWLWRITQNYWVGFVAQIYAYFSMLVPRVCVRFATVFIVYFRVISRRIRLVSGVNLTGVVHWLKLALSKGPNWMGVFSPLHLKTETSNFRNVVFSVL